MQEAASRSHQIIADFGRRLEEISEHRSLWRYGKEKWSKREILGHLIDSASTNHHRFVRARHANPMRFPTYEQNEWVTAQHYHDSPWIGLVTLWKAYNLHLAHIIAKVPPDTLDTPCYVHFDRPVRLEWVISDYLEHMLHHLNQIVEDFQAADSYESVPDYANI